MASVPGGLMPTVDRSVPATSKDQKNASKADRTVGHGMAVRRCHNSRKMSPAPRADARMLKACADPGLRPGGRGMFGRFVLNQRSSCPVSMRSMAAATAGERHWPPLQWITSVAARSRTAAQKSRIWRAWLSANATVGLPWSRLSSTSSKASRSMPTHSPPPEGNAAGSLSLSVSEM